MPRMQRLGALLLFALSAARSDAARPITLEDYYRVETAATPAMSPDGRWVVFVRNSIIETENQRHTELWIAPADGSAAPSRLTNPAFNATAPKWSPDGQLIAFRSTRKAPGTEGEIWFLRMDRPGGEAFQISGVGGPPVFSPDSHWIAFTKKTTPAAKKSSELSPAERQLEQRFKGRIYDWMNIRFDGRGYLPDPRDPLASPPAEVYVVPREGGAAKQLTHLGVDAQTPVWNPDSNALALIADSHQRDEYSYERADLWIVDMNGQIRRLTDDGFEHDSPAWSPDGRSLVFRRRQGLNQIIQARQNHGSAVDLYRMSSDGGALSNLTAQWDLIPDAPTWNPKGDFLYFGAGTGGDLHLFRVPAAGGRVERITQGDRGLGGFSFSRNFEQMAYTATDPQHPAEVFAARTDAKGEVKLSALNDWTKDVDLVPSERVHFKSKDGTDVEGWIMLPRSAKAPYPLILAIHGGPHGAYGNHFDYEFQWLAANGYAVLFTNPRGSTGYGEKFLWGTWGGWGKLDYQDVMAGVDYALDHYPIDRKRLGVTGYSYGGFLTDWIITQTDRFAAAVTGAGISNWLSDYGTADIPRTKESEFFGAPWDQEASERMRALSPITHAANVKTPTLFVHGEADRRVPIEEAEQMYTALKKRHVAAKFIRYPGNYHGGWPPWDMVHRYHYEVEWWNEKLRP